MNTAHAATDRADQPANDVGDIFEVAAGLPVKPPPTLGDHLTLYEYRETTPWLKMSPATIRRHVATGAIPREYITKHPGPKGRVYMTGDQICRLLSFFASGQRPPEPTGRPYAGRRTRRAAA